MFYLYAISYRLQPDNGTEDFCPSICEFFSLRSMLLLLILVGNCLKWRDGGLNWNWGQGSWSTIHFQLSAGRSFKGGSCSSRTCFDSTCVYGSGTMYMQNIALTEDKQQQQHQKQKKTSHPNLLINRALSIVLRQEESDCNQSLTLSVGPKLVAPRIKSM